MNLLIHNKIQHSNTHKTIIITTTRVDTSKVTLIIRRTTITKTIILIGIIKVTSIMEVILITMEVEGWTLGEI